MIQRLVRCYYARPWRSLPLTDDLVDDALLQLWHKKQ